MLDARCLILDTRCWMRRCGDAWMREERWEFDGGTADFLRALRFKLERSLAVVFYL